jgi:phage-related minor tail protein
MMDFLKQKEAIDEFYKNLEEKELAQIDYQNSFAGGWTTAFEEYIKSATNAANQAQAIFGAMTNGMNSAIDNFVETGKFSFSDFASSVIKDILKIQLKAAAANLFATSGLGTIFGVQARANGGPVNASSPYLVGEKGPELFIPASSGSIVPNNKIGSGGTGASNTFITNNISAIDSRSVAQLFAENRQVLFGNVEQARRELPLRTR